jgi:exodeoxyribonuclease-3
MKISEQPFDSYFDVSTVRKSSSLCILTLALILGTSHSRSNAQEHLKVLTYNIWNGYEWGKDTIRKQQLLGWVFAQKPDIVAWQELCNYTDAQLQADALQLGHYYSALLKTTGYSVGLTSKYPIEIQEKILTDMHHGALHCKVAGVDIIVVHLSPSSFRKRKAEAAILMDRIHKIALSNERYLVLGDFNAHSPFDADLYKDEVLLNRMRKMTSNRDNSGNLNNDDLDYETMSTFIAGQLMDLARKFTNGMAQRGSFPGRVLGKVNQETDRQLIDRLERIDYIMASSAMALKCVDARVMNGSENWNLSDHYPVMAVIKDIGIRPEK